MKVSKLMVTAALAGLVFTGCTYKVEKTPAVMTYDGTGLDYSKIDELKKSKVCTFLADGEGDNTIVNATKQAGISKVKHVDISSEHDTFLFWNYGYRKCVTVYGE